MIPTLEDVEELVRLADKSGLKFLLKETEIERFKMFLEYYEIKKSSRTYDGYDFAERYGISIPTLRRTFAKYNYMFPRKIKNLKQKAYDIEYGNKKELKRKCTN